MHKTKLGRKFGVLVFCLFVLRMRERAYVPTLYASRLSGSHLDRRPLTLRGSPFALARVGPGVRRVAAIALLLLDATASWRGWANETQAKTLQRRNAAIVENQTSKMKHSVKQNTTRKVFFFFFLKE